MSTGFQGFIKKLCLGGGNNTTGGLGGTAPWMLIISVTVFDDL